MTSTSSSTSSSPSSSCSGGKWTPEQILEHDPAWLSELGLELSPAALWAPGEGGLLEAVVRLDGCSAGFVSADGLLVTNHHCAFGLLQEHSTAERDLITDGFLAADRSEELPGANVRATIPHRFVDVTEDVEAAVPAGVDDLERFRAIERRRKELVAESERRPFCRAQVATYDDGRRYALVEALEYRDVRLVYAPPRGVGDFGGAVDNWTFPRHAGDFTLLRVYADAGNHPTDPGDGERPLEPRRHLPIARRGAEAGDFVMVLGYPGLTYRSLVGEEVAERAELFFPRRAALHRAWLDILEGSAAADEDASRILAARIKSLANREKNARGQVASFARGGLLEKKRAAEAEILAWCAEHPEHAAAVDAHAELQATVAELRRTTWERDFLLGEAGQGPLCLRLALLLARAAVEREKDDLEREEGYQDRDRDHLARTVERQQKELHSATERRLLADLLRRFDALPADRRVEAVDRLLEETDPAAAAEKLTSTTRVDDLEARREMLGEGVVALRARRDPLVDFAFDLLDDHLAAEERAKRRRGVASRCRPVWRQAVEAFQGRPLDPDANGTLRVSLAEVRGYVTAAGRAVEPFTRVAEIAAKHTGERPFRAPAAVLAAASVAPTSRFASSVLGDVPVCFLATGDTTGGNSGSPMVNGRGELVGVNFDRVWENVANDFAYDPEVARNVVADVRYLLWLLEDVAGPDARWILDELGVAPSAKTSG